MAKQTTQTTEEEFNLRRLTRRRLIGAIALVLVVVILLPIVFDSEPPATGNGIELRIPNKDNAGDFQPKIDLPELDKMASEVAVASSAASAPVVAAEPAVAVVPAPVISPVAPTPVAAPVAPAPSQPKQEAKPVVKPQPKPVAKPQAVPKTGWAVQVGAFANADTARTLQAKLSKQGYHAYTEKAGNVVRVRVGGYPTREAAEKIESKLEAQGMQANVVTLD